MPNVSIKLRRNFYLNELLARTFPDYNGRKISAEIASRYFVSNAWDGGTRNECVALWMATGQIAQAQAEQYGTWIEIPPGVAIIEHAIFQGHDCGIRIYCNPGDLPQFTEGRSVPQLPSAA